MIIVKYCEHKRILFKAVLSISGHFVCLISQVNWVTSHCEPKGSSPSSLDCISHLRQNEMTALMAIPVMAKFP